MKYLPLYYKWISEGVLPGGSGLCKAFEEVGFGYTHLYDRFAANATECASYGGIGKLWRCSRGGEFNATRQNIILLMAAMNNEL